MSNPHVRKAFPRFGAVGSAYKYSVNYALAVMVQHS